MKTLEKITLRLSKCKSELSEFKTLLPEWSSRFDHGFSQILDWFLVLEDLKRTGLRKSKFDLDVIQYVGLLVIGRRKDLDDRQYERLVWRSEEVHVGSRQVNCITFDDLYDTLALKVQIFG